MTETGILVTDLQICYSGYQEYKQVQSERQKENVIVERYRMKTRYFGYG